MALAPDIGLLLTCEIDKYIDLVASERVHELYGVLHYRNPNSDTRFRRRAREGFTPAFVAGARKTCPLDALQAFGGGRRGCKSSSRGWPG